MNNDTNMMMQELAMVLSRLSQVEGRVESMFDDLPEPADGIMQGGGGETLLFAFKVTVVPTGEETAEIRVASGRRRVIGKTGWEIVSSPEPYNFSEGANVLVYMRRVMPVFENTDGVIIETEAGYWDGGVKIGGDVDDDGNLDYIVRIATIDENGIVTYEHLGNVTVLDIKECP